MELIKAGASSRGVLKTNLARPAVPQGPPTAGVVIVCWAMGVNGGIYYPDETAQYNIDVAAMQEELPSNYAIGLISPYKGGGSNQLAYCKPDGSAFPSEITTIEYNYTSPSSLSDFQGWQTIIEGSKTWETTDIWVLWDTALHTDNGYGQHIEEGQGEQDYYDWLEAQDYTLHAVFGYDYWPLSPGFYDDPVLFRNAPGSGSLSWVEAITQALEEFNAL